LGVRDQKLLSGVHLQPLQRPRKMQQRLQLEGSVSLLQIVAIAEEKMAVAEHPKVARAVVESPKRLGLDGTFGQYQHHRANLALVVVRCPRPVDQPRRAKREQQPILVEKVQ